MKTFKKVLALLLCVGMFVGSIAGLAITANANVSLKAIPEGLTAALAKPAPVVDTTNVGYNIQRTMHLLETSSAEKPNTVRVAFCGQSITDGTNNQWPAAIVAYLKAKYPNANILSKNFGIGGYNTWLMKNIYQNDISSFYPDLIFFYDYGDVNIYKTMLNWIRDNSVAEIIIQGNHVDLGGYANDQSDVELKQMASEVNCEFADVRTYWKKYLADNNLEASALLEDNVHLNHQGQALMFEILKQFFVYKPVENSLGEYNDQTTTYVSGEDFEWKDGKATIEFTGNRVEVITLDQVADGTASADVLVNGKKPSTYLSLYNHSRYSNLQSHVFASYYNYIEFLKPHTPQKWTMEFDGGNGYVLIGDVSGNVGTGSIDSEFVTSDGSMAFYPNFWYNDPNGSMPIYLEFETTLNGTDSIKFSGTELVASNLPEMDNELVLTSTGATPKIAVKVYTPGYLLSKPQVNEVKVGDKAVSGVAKAGATVYVAIGDSIHKATADNEGKFTVNLPAISGKVTVDVYYESGKHKSQITRLAMGDGAENAPKLTSVKGGITASTTKVTGKASAYAMIKVINGKSTFVGYANANGKFSVKVKKLVPGKLKVVAMANGLTTKAKTVKVAPKNPTIKAVAKTGVISGTADAKAKLTIYVGKKKIKTCKANAKGKYSVKAKGKFKKGAKISVVATVNGTKSKKVTKKAK